MTEICVNVIFEYVRANVSLINNFLPEINGFKIVHHLHKVDQFSGWPSLHYYSSTTTSSPLHTTFINVPSS